MGEGLKLPKLDEMVPNRPKHFIWLDGSYGIITRFDRVKFGSRVNIFLGTTYFCFLPILSCNIENEYLQNV